MSRRSELIQMSGKTYRAIYVDADLTFFEPHGWEHPRKAIGTMRHVGFGGVTRHIEADMSLGIGRRRDGKRRGLRRAIWDAAYGYVSGFAVRDIAYYVATRSFSERVMVRAIRREREKERANA